MSSPLPGDRVVVFARAPELGRVKTRLAATVGQERALEIYVRLASLVTQAVAQGPWSTEIRCAPDGAVSAVAEWLGVRDVVPQGDGDLGARLTRTMTDHFAAGHGRLVIIGTDCPEVDAAVIRRAFDALRAVDVVLGPALDGGYYLVGCAHQAPEIFQEVPWSAPDTLAVTLKHARTAGYSVAELASLRDIDTEEDWLAWRAASSAEPASGDLAKRDLGHGHDG